MGLWRETESENSQQRSTHTNSRTPTLPYHGSTTASVPSAPKRTVVATTEPESGSAHPRPAGRLYAIVPLSLGAPARLAEIPPAGSTRVNRVGDTLTNLLSQRSCVPPWHCVGTRQLTFRFLPKEHSSWPIPVMPSTGSSSANPGSVAQGPGNIIRTPHQRILHGTTPALETSLLRLQRIAKWGRPSTNTLSC